MPQADALTKVRAKKLPVNVFDILYVDDVEGQERWAVMCRFADGTQMAYVIPADMVTQANVQVSSIAAAVIWHEFGPGPHPPERDQAEA